MAKSPLVVAATALALLTGATPPTSSPPSAPQPVPTFAPNVTVADYQCFALFSMMGSAMRKREKDGLLTDKDRKLFQVINAVTHFHAGRISTVPATEQSHNLTAAIAALPKNKDEIKPDEMQGKMQPCTQRMTQTYELVRETLPVKSQPTPP